MAEQPLHEKGAGGGRRSEMSEGGGARGRVHNYGNRKRGLKKNFRGLLITTRIRIRKVMNYRKKKKELDLNRGDVGRKHSNKKLPEPEGKQLAWVDGLNAQISLYMKKKKKTCVLFQQRSRTPRKNAGGSKQFQQRGMITKL